MSEQAIVLNELTKHYGKHRGINNLSFSVNQGEFFGFIGPNGAGKSTTIRTLMGLIRPTGGSASIFDLDCHSKASVIARDVGYLPSENSYYENMKVRELLQYTADLYGMDCKTKMKELADRLNLDLSRKIADLSLGNKKKVGIVSAIMTSPKLIIMDEPTSGLDPLIQQAFYDILKEENSRGATVFFSSHVLSEVQKLCDRVAILNEGQLIGIQSIKELRESGYNTVFVLAAYVLAFTAEYTGTRFLDYLTPLRYYDVYEVALNGVYLSYIVLTVLIVGACVMVSTRRWKLREL